MNSTKITVSESEKLILLKISRQKTSSVREVERSLILLSLISEKSSLQVSNKLGLPWEKIQRCRQRWLEFELIFASISSKKNKDVMHELEKKVRECLKDAARVGCPSKFTSTQYCKILAVSVEDPKLSGRPISQWTHKELALEVQKRGIVSSISSSQIGNFLKSMRYKTS